MQLTITFGEAAVLVTVIASIAVQFFKIDRNERDNAKEHKRLEKTDDDQWVIIRQQQVEHASCCGRHPCKPSDLEALRNAPTL